MKRCDKCKKRFERYVMWEDTDRKLYCTPCMLKINERKEDDP